jgi:NDP-sugar pyrophosphorylase family protein
MAAYKVSEYLSDIGTLENYQAAQKFWPGLVETQQAGRRE